MKTATTIVTTSIATVIVCVLTAVSYAVYEGRSASYRVYATHTDVISVCAREVWTEATVLLKPCIQQGFREVEQSHARTRVVLMQNALSQNFADLGKSRVELIAQAQVLLEKPARRW